jgi:hypothetical protein
LNECSASDTHTVGAQQKYKYCVLWLVVADIIKIYFSKNIFLFISIVAYRSYSLKNCKMKHTKNNNSSLDFRNSQQFSFESQEFKVCVKLEASTAFKSFSPLKEGRKQI